MEPKPLFILLLLQVSALSFGQPLSLILSSSSGAPGAPVSLSIALHSIGGTRPAGVQWTLRYAPADFAAVRLMAGPAAMVAGKSIYCAPQSGSMTCLAAGINSNLIPDGVVASATFEISPTAAGRSSPIQLTNTVAASLDGSEILISGTGGDVTIVQPPQSALDVQRNHSYPGIFREAGALGQWALDRNANYQFDFGIDSFHNFGLAGDIPVVGDWTGSGVMRLGVFRCPPVGSPGVCQWFVDLNNNGRWDGTAAGGDAIYNFGVPGDIPVVGDWTGDGRSKIGVFRCPLPGAGICQFILDVNANNTFDAGDAILSYGLPGDTPVIGKWNPLRHADLIGVFRCPAPGAGLCQWIVDSNGDGIYEPTDAVYFYGLPGDQPVIGDWSSFVTLGRKRIGVFRNGLWILDTNGNNTFDSADLLVSFGLPGDKAVTGNWPLPPADSLPDEPGP
jgi:hypothetical protein